MRWILSALEPIDSDVDLDDPTQRRELRRTHGLVLLVIAAGGVLGSLLRYQFGRWWPTPAATFPWTTVVVNLTGCLVIGSFMVLLTQRWSAYRLLRPFFGTGVLGGYTTFSAYAVDIVVLTRAGHPIAATAYLVVTVTGAFLAVSLGMLVTRWILQ